MKETDLIRKDYNLIIVGFSLGVFYWIVDSFLDTFLSGNTFIDMLFHPGWTNAFDRLFVAFLFIAFSAYGRYVVTKRKLAEDKLKDSEEKFRSTFELAAVGVAYVGTDGRFLRLNQKFCDIVGYTRDELLEKTFQDITYPNDLSSDLEQASQLLAGQIPSFSMEKRYIRKDGTNVWVNLTGSIVRGNSRINDYFIAIVEDITERKLVEEALSKSEKALKEAQRLAKIGSWDWDATTDTITWSKEYYHIYGFDPTQRPAGYEDHLKVYTPESAAQLDAAVKRNMQTGESYELDLELTSAEGPRRWITARSETKRNAQGQIKGLCGTAQDITERKRAEERLAKLNNCMLGFGTDSIVNINSLTALCGELMGAACALYNRLDQGMLCSWGKWNTPPGYNPVDKPEGHICYDTINQGTDEIIVVQNLPETRYARTDPNVMAYDLRTYVGRAVRFSNDYMGSLCVVYQKDYLPQEDEKRLMGVIASAIAVEERRRHAEEALKESEEKYHALMNDAGDAIILADKNGNVLEVNKKMEELLGYTKEEFSNMNIAQIHPKEELERTIATFKVCANLNDGQVQRNDGKIVPVDITRSAVEYAGRKAILGIFRDITERKLAEDALRRKEEHFRSLIENALDTITILNKDGTIIYESPSIERVLGYKPEELTGKNSFEFIHPEDLPGVMSAFNLGIQNPGSTQSAEYRFKHKDGSWLVLESIGKLMLENAGSTYVIVNSRDITERKRAEEALSRSEEKYRMLIDNMQDGVFILQDGKVQFVNESFAILAGYSVEEVLGRDFLNFIAPEDKERVIDNYSRRLAGENAPREYELNLLHKDGARIIANLNVGLITYRGRTASMGTMKDITERKRAEEALRESEEKYRALMNDAGDAIILIDIEGNIVEVNKKTEELTGYTKNELLTMKIFQLHPKEEIERITVSFKEGIQKGSATLNDLPILRKDGKIVPVDLTGNNVVFAGKLVVQATFRDITERKHAEEQIKASLKEKEVLLREIHHRVKNNMQIISSLLNLQAGYIEDKKYLDMLKDSQNRIMIMSLVHEKLYMSKNFTKINFKDYIHNLASSVFQSYSSRSGNILLNMNIEDVELGIDSAIPCGLIINELVTNSLKYAFPGEKKGEIKIVLGKKDKNEYELIVSDNGIGFPEDIDFRKTETLGLHLVSVLAEEQLSGKINLNRRKGTEFIIRFGEEK